MNREIMRQTTKTMTVESRSSSFFGQVTLLISLTTSVKNVIIFSFIASLEGPGPSESQRRQGLSHCNHSICACLISLHVRRDSNPQPAVLETAALPIELLTYPFPSTESPIGGPGEGSAIWPER